MQAEVTVPDVRNKAGVLCERFKLGREDAEAMVEVGRLTWCNVYDLPTIEDVRAKVNERHEFSKKVSSL